MPESVIPFKPNSKSFFISIFVIMAIVRLLFVLIGALVRRPWLWRKVAAWKKTIQLDELRQRFAMNGNDCGCGLREGYTGDVEMEGWESQG
jgi:hypothetical protein